MKEVFEVVGETAAQSIWNLSAGGSLIPLFSTVDQDGHANYMQLAMDNSDDAIRYGRDKLERHEDGKVGAVLIADGYISIEGDRTDALVLEVRIYTDVTVKCQMVIPYRSANSANGFAILRPQITALENIDEIKFQPMLDAFFVGVEAHDKGGKIWHEYYRDDDAVVDHSDNSVSFDSDAWHLMQQAPLLAFYLIAAPDGHARKSDVEAFDSILASGVKYQSSVLNRILPHARQNYPTLIDRLDGGDVDYLQQFERALSSISMHYSKSETKGLKLALIAMAQDVLLVTGSSIPEAAMNGGGGKMSLARLIVAMDIELDS